MTINYRNDLVIVNPCLQFFPDVLSIWIHVKDMNQRVRLVTFCSEDRAVTHHHRTFKITVTPTTHKQTTPQRRESPCVFFFFCLLLLRKMSHMRQEKSRRGIWQAHIKAETVLKWQNCVCLEVKHKGGKLNSSTFQVKPVSFLLISQTSGRFSLPSYVKQKEHSPFLLLN